MEGKYRIEDTGTDSVTTRDSRLKKLEVVAIQAVAAYALRVADAAVAYTRSIGWERGQRV